jgi:hypothetical protein
MLPRMPITLFLLRSSRRLDYMKRLALALSAVALFGSGLPARASLITYTVATTGTGTLDGVSFTNAVVTITLVGDTSNLFTYENPNGNGFQYEVPGISAMVDVSGVGSDTFTDPTYVGAVTGPAPGAWIADGTVDGTAATVLEVYEANSEVDNLTTSIGPVTGFAGINPSLSFPTASGAFTLTSVCGLLQSGGDSATFTESTSGAVGGDGDVCGGQIGGGGASPEPSSIVLLISGLAVAAALRYRRLLVKLH